MYRNRFLMYCTKIGQINCIYRTKTPFPFLRYGSILRGRKEVGRMLDLLDLYDGTEREESTADTPDEVEFACVYFTYYPYLYANT